MVGGRAKASGTGRLCYPADVFSASASFVRTRAIDDVLGMTPSERVALAFAFGDEDLARYLRATGVERDQAMRDLRRARACGRRPSIANEP